MAMLRRTSSPTPFVGGWGERECPRCHRAVELPLGVLCSECIRQLELQARRLGRLIGGLSTVVMALYVWVRMPDNLTARTVGAIAIGVWYVLSYMVIKRVARQLLQ